MRIARVIGNLVLNQIHPKLVGGTFKIAIPLALDELVEDQRGAAEELVVYDENGAGWGQKIMLSEGGEAAQPFYPDIKPVDAYNAGNIDQLHFHAGALREIERS